MGRAPAVQMYLHSRIDLDRLVAGDHSLDLMALDPAPPTLRPLPSLAEEAFNLFASADQPMAGGLSFHARAYLDTDAAFAPFVGVDGDQIPFSLGQAALKEAGGSVSATHCLAGLSYSLGGTTAGSIAYRYSRRKDAMFGGEGRTQFDSFYDSHGIELALRLRF